MKSMVGQAKRVTWWFILAGAGYGAGSVLLWQKRWAEAIAFFIIGMALDTWATKRFVRFCKKLVEGVRNGTL